MSFSTVNYDECDELVKRGYDAISRGAVDEIGGLIHPEFRCDAPSGAPDRGSLSGRRRFERYLDELAAEWEEFRFELEELRHAGELVVALVREEGRARSTGEWVSQESFHIWTVRDGKAVRFGRHPRVHAAA